VALSDAELVALALRQAQPAYRELLVRYQRPVYNLIVRMVQDPALAEDLAQDTFVKAFGRLITFNRRYKFSNWLLKIAHNTAIDHLRLRRVPTVSLDAGAADKLTMQLAAARSEMSPALALEQSDLASALNAALRRLRVEYREAVVLRYHEGLSHEEIAEVMGLPVGTVKSHLHRARAELAGYLLDAGWGPGS
jgi:RNA polymerase sigma-70 factor, ECF subfamily